MDPLQSHCQEKIIRRGGLNRDGLSGIGDWEYRLLKRRLRQEAALYEFFFGANQRSQALGQKRGVERLLERLVYARTIEAGRASVVGQ